MVRADRTWLARVGGIPWFLRRFGWRQLFLKPLRMWGAPFIVPRLRPGAVMFRGEALPLFYHPHNVTWANERAVELPIAFRFMRGVRPRDILEVGRVTPHYMDAGHTVVDKYEPGGVMEDIVDYQTDQRFGLILSVSTFEHIAFDEDPPVTDEVEIAARVRAAVDKCLSLLAPGGVLLVTLPFGYNPAVTRMIADDELGCDRAVYLKRFPRRDWREVERAEALACRYARPYVGANAIMVAEWDGP